MLLASLFSSFAMSAEVYVQTSVPEGFPVALQISELGAFTLGKKNGTEFESKFTNHSNSEIVTFAFYEFHAPANETAGEYLRMPGYRVLSSQVLFIGTDQTEGRFFPAPGLS